MKKVICSQMRVVSEAEMQQIHGGTAQRYTRTYGGCVGGASSSQGNSGGRNAMSQNAKGGSSSGRGCVGGA